MFSRQVKKVKEENTHNIEVVNEDISDENLERDKIKELIKGFEMEEMGFEGKPRPQSNSSVLFVLDIDNQGAGGGSSPSPIKSNTGSFIPFSGIYAEDSADTDSAQSISDSLYVGDIGGLEEKDSSLLLDSLENVIDMKQSYLEDNSLLASLQEIEPVVEEVPEEPDANEWQNLDLTALEEIEDVIETAVEDSPVDEPVVADVLPEQDDEVNIVHSYVKIIEEMSSGVDAKHFFVDSSQNLAEAKTIDGVTYINQVAAAHIYNLAMNEIQKNQLDIAKVGLKLICLTSIDKKYVNMALDVLKTDAMCLQEEFIDIVNETIEKESLLIGKIKQLYDMT